MENRQVLLDSNDRKKPSKAIIIIIAIILVAALLVGAYVYISHKNAQGPIGAVAKKQQEIVSQQFVKTKALSPDIYHEIIDEDLLLVVASYQTKELGKLAVPYFVLRTDDDWDVLDVNYNSAALLTDPKNIEHYTSSDTFVEQFGDYTVIWIGFYLLSKQLEVSDVHDSLGTKPIELSKETLKKPERGWGGWATAFHGVSKLNWETELDLKVYSAVIVVKDMPENYTISFGDQFFTYDDLMERLALKNGEA